MITAAPARAGGRQDHTSGWGHAARVAIRPPRSSRPRRRLASQTREGTDGARSSPHRRGSPMVPLLGRVAFMAGAGAMMNLQVAGRG